MSRTSRASQLANGYGEMRRLPGTFDDSDGTSNDADGTSHNADCISDNVGGATDQSFINGNFAGNRGDNNIYGSTIINNFGLEVLSHVPETFQELIGDTRWRVSLPEIDLNHLCDEYNRPEPGTGEWIFKDDKYRGWWEGGESKFLWLCGGPGIGKTALAKRVAAEFLERPRGPQGGVKLVFHFVSPGFPTDGISADEAKLLRQRRAKIASDLLYSILQQDEKLFHGSKAELIYQGDKLFTNPDSLWKVLGNAIQDCNADPVYILIDGVDRLEETLCTELIRRIIGLMKTHRVKIFLSSRNVPYVLNTLSRNLPEYTRIDLDADSLGSIRKDVKTFIERRVDGLGWNVNLKKKAKEALLAKSEGTFLWASLAVENLEFFSSGPDFDVFLGEGLSKLEDIYRPILSSLSKREGSEKVLNMVRSVALALRPLTFGELGHALAFMEEGSKTEQFSHGEASTQIRPIIEKEEVRRYVQSSLGFLRATDTTVSLVHHTAREYLFAENSNGLSVLLKSEADLKISWECFRYLHQAFADPGTFQEGNDSAHHDRSQDSSSRKDHKEEALGEAPWEVARNDPQGAVLERPYLKYAAESWFIHARRSIGDSGNKFCGDPTRDWLQHQFFKTSDVIRKPWIRLCGNPNMEVLAGEQTPLHIAVCLGLMPLVTEALLLFEEPRETNNQRSPLHLAAKFMSEAYKIMIPTGKRWLLTDPDQDGNTPLHQAVISGHWSMLNGLVKWFTEHSEYSKEINKKNRSGNTPLHLAFQFDHPEIVRLLVKGGADATIENDAQLTASELGEKLRREDSLHIVRQAEEIGKGAEEIRVDAGEIGEDAGEAGGNPGEIRVDAGGVGVGAREVKEDAGEIRGEVGEIGGEAGKIGGDVGEIGAGAGNMGDAGRGSIENSIDSESVDGSPLSQAPPGSHPHSSSEALLRERVSRDSRVGTDNIDGGEGDRATPKPWHKNYLLLGILAILCLSIVISIAVTLAAKGHK